MTFKRKIKDVVTGEETTQTLTDVEAVAQGFRKDPVVEAQELEADVQKVADDILLNGDRDVAIAKATIDLVFALRDGQIDGLTKPEVTALFRDRVVHYLRKSRGL